jgi:mRNA-degrading endonuclease RelE of RelBE toxin-antitoxin system
MAKVLLSAEARSGFDALPLPVKVRVQSLFERLANWPDVSGAKPLRGRLSGSYRLRTGDYRVQFHVASGDVVVDRIGHRDGFYED